MRTEAAPPTTKGQALADIGHVHLRVADLDRALAFYVETIGMRVVLQQPKHAFLAFGDYHHHLALDARGAFDPRSEDADRRAGLHHFAIRFPDEASLRAVVDRLRARGSELKGADFTALRAVFTRDPDGNGVELSCDRPRESWPATWASVDGIGRWRPLDPAELGELPSEPSRFLRRRPGAGDAYWTLGMRLTVLVPGSGTEGRFELSEMECPPRFATPLHVHSREDETFRVLEGRIRYLCGEIVDSAAAGATIHLPRGVPHAFATSGETTARLLHSASPAGMLGFHIAAGTPASGAGPGPAEVDRAAVAEIAASYGIVTLGPPPGSLFSQA
jgi:catechol 2,3-dioxygenase